MRSFRRCALPLAGEGGSALQQQEWVRDRAAAPHPTVLADVPKLPSPAKGAAVDTAARTRLALAITDKRFPISPNLLEPNAPLRVLMLPAAAR